MPELPESRRRRFIEEYGLSLDDAAQLTDSRAMADYFEADDASVRQREGGG